MSPDVGVGARQCPRCGRTYPTGKRVCEDDGEPLSLPDPYHLVDRTIADRYRLDALIGIGGMGAVYSARHLTIERRIAVKILQPNIAVLDQRMVELFEREAKTVGRLVHPNIGNVFDAGRTDEGIAYMVMEWLDGGSLEEELASVRTLSLERTAEYLRQIAAALDAAHAASIIHRDLKPANIMLVRATDGRDQLKVVDFGIAKAISDVTQTAHSVVTGTPAYASPEQLAGVRLDARSDVYSLGVILYRMLTGALPFSAASVEELVKQKRGPVRVRVRTARPEVPLAVEQLVLSMLAHDPDDRPAKASDVSRLFTNAVTIPSLRWEDVSWEAPPPDPHEPAVAPAPTSADTDAQARGVDGALSGGATVKLWSIDNPLLSEFDFLRSRRDSRRWQPGSGTIALAAASGGLVVLLLSHWVGAACIRVVLRGPTGLEHPLVFGYVAEPNAALWYLVGVPVFLIVASHFLKLTHTTLRELAGGERLVALSDAGVPMPSPLAAIARLNRRWFRVVTPLIFVLSFSAVYIPEFAVGPGPAFGWVGSVTVKDLEGVSIRELQDAKRLGAFIPGIASLCSSQAPACDIRVASVTGGHGAADQGRWGLRFRIFVIAALGLQVLFGLFAGWIAAKVLFLFGVFTRALVNRSERGLKIELDFADSEMRFGLGALDVVHNMVLLLTLLAGVVFLLQRMANVTKGTSFFAGMTGLPLMSQFGVFVISMLPLLLILGAPMAVFMILLETEVGRAIEGIERERAAFRKSVGGATPPHQRAAIERAEEHLRRRRDLVRRQRPWPRKNAAYRGLLAATIFTLAVLPFAIEYSAISDTLQILSRSAARVSDILCWLL